MPELYISFSLLYLSNQTGCLSEAKPCPWPDIWQAYRKKLFAGLKYVEKREVICWIFFSLLIARNQFSF